MYKILMLATMVYITGCAPKTEVVDVINGKDGINGQDAPACQIYPSEGSTTIQCGEQAAVIYDGQDGVQGPAGEAGQDATAIASRVTVSTTCTLVGDSASAKRDGDGSNIKLYTTTNCTGGSFNMNAGSSALTPNGEVVVKSQNSNELYLINFGG